MSERKDLQFLHGFQAQLRGILRSVDKELVTGELPEPVNINELSIHIETLVEPAGALALFFKFPSLIGIYTNDWRKVRAIRDLCVWLLKRSGKEDG